MPDLWLATSSEVPTGGPEDGPALDSAFAALAVDARWAVWDDPTVDWSAAPLVAVRSTWDYHTRHEEFLDWAAAVDAVTTLVNPLPVLRWNSVKTYLTELPVPTIPTTEVRDSFAAEVATVVKPAVGASGSAVLVVPAGGRVEAAPYLQVAQPLLESVRTEGEHSVYVLGGVAVAAAIKLPAGGEIRVHEEYGGRTVRADLTAEKSELALAAVRAVEQRFGVALPYARADLMRHDGRLVISELELVEPGLYGHVLPEVPEAYAAVMSDVLSRATA